MNGFDQSTTKIHYVDIGRIVIECGFLGFVSGVIFEDVGNFLAVGYCNII